MPASAVAFGGVYGGNEEVEQRCVVRGVESLPTFAVAVGVVYGFSLPANAFANSAALAASASALSSSRNSSPVMFVTTRGGLSATAASEGVESLRSDSSLLSSSTMT